mgnify:CR=1 FL=1
MADNSQIKATQERIFRIAQRRGLTLKAISLDAHHPASENGRDIGPTECRNLRLKLAAVNGRAA